MFFKHLKLIIIVLLICLAANVIAADVSYTGNGDDHLWTNAENWNGPIPDDSSVGASFNKEGTEVEITNGVNAACKGFMLGMYGVTNSATISGGGLTCSWLDIGRANQNGGNGSLTITDGNVTVSGSVKLPTQFSTMTNIDKMGTGHIDLLGGTLTCGSFYMGNQQVGNNGGIGTMEITHGTLVVNGNQTALLQGYINSTWITFYGGGGDYELDYGVKNSGKTTLSAVSTGQAFNPKPNHNAANVPIDKVLNWSVEATTGSVNVYFGTADPPTFIRNQPLTEKTYAPGQLAYNTTYYWRIDQVDGQDELQGNVWSFKTEGPPAQAMNPEPANSGNGINPNIKLSWTDIPDSDSYDVYFGDSNPPAFIGTQDSNVYDPPMLSANQIYYWRIDSQNQHGKTVGDVWSFTVSNFPDGDINGDWFVDLQDLKLFFSHWLEEGCQLSNWCSNADANQDSIVNLLDYRMLQSQFSHRKPNIIIFYTDDQGWAETSVPMAQGRADSCSDFLQTPALEKMAQQGMVFSNAYSCAPTCTPSRAGIQFGKTPARLKYSVVHDRLAHDRGIDLKDQLSIAQLVKSIDSEYVTAHFGKWGFSPRSPDHAEYDQSDGNTNNGEGDFLSVQDRTPLPPDDPKRIFSIADRTDAFIEEQVAQGKPFFMQLSHYAVHVDSMALAETIEKYRNLPAASDPKYRGEDAYVYAAMIENLDTALGRLLQKVEELGIKDNTYIIFTSDNGGGFRGNKPLKGGKANLWEGGLRVPTVICGPGVLKETYCDTPIAAWDFFPTINEIIGGQPLPAEYDGGSIVDLLMKGNDGNINRGTKELFFHFPWYGSAPPVSAMRDGDYKLMMSLNNDEYRLFDLSTDIGEENDLKYAMPDLAQQMHERLLQYLEDVDAEDVEDMRLARINEVQGYIQDELAKPNPDPARIQSLQEQIEVFQRNRLLDMDGNIF
ncbi:MAG: sulfatase-like hydrolase/transferase [Phycisphaerae bacterium]|nr:sulfatase-like hydrolase/transferase [Phycisphaerae bacterium]